MDTDEKPGSLAWVEQLLASGGLPQMQASPADSARLAAEVARIAGEQERLALDYAGDRYKG